jgi:hypothetical protein
MTHPDPNEPPRWRELCSKLQNEKDPAKFQALLKEIEQVLSAWECKNKPALPAQPKP